jgi:hypothetical protein
MPSREEAIAFLENRVLRPAESNPAASGRLRQKIGFVRMQLNRLTSADKVKEYFWNAMESDGGIDTYRMLHDIGATAFEDVRREFKDLWP